MILTFRLKPHKIVKIVELDRYNDLFNWICVCGDPQSEHLIDMCLFSSTKFIPIRHSKCGSKLIHDLSHAEFYCYSCYNSVPLESKITMNMKRFYINRTEDVSGISGTGIVAEGVLWTDGRAQLRWLGPVDSFEIFNTLDELKKIHGHEGRTSIVFIDL